MNELFLMFDQALEQPCSKCECSKMFGHKRFTIYLRISKWKIEKFTTKAHQMFQKQAKSGRHGLMVTNLQQNKMILAPKLFNSSPRWCWTVMWLLVNFVRVLGRTTSGLKNFLKVFLCEEILCASFSIFFLC